ncbi:uncharacterized protein E5676_scaffold1607G00300 [Cucumis melo var. makuwa]|uniref:Uncharacterized protein n=1 Tax=Cucumis melo var. makuwa TaxID=1194695 RepID=A0A5A7UZF8_CUCMM|nr:uncharacterized protein E6C27_scaffold98G00760 [Cucumis melo var. makuwa]TYK23717.1 uncharacterized protein E5676_scaffold1607G00300 [Cucumis melo var. makuwa]
MSSWVSWSFLSFLICCDWVSWRMDCFFYSYQLQALVEGGFCVHGCGKIQVFVGRVINLGTLEEVKEVRISTLASEQDQSDLVTVLHEFKDIFAWSYHDMSDLDTEIVTHRLPLKPELTKYPIWVANIVPVPKKDEKVRMCVNYRDLNQASPKDNFPLPHIDVLIDNTAGFSTFSFMDRFSGYNQIKMAPKDQEKMTFITLWETFYYKSRRHQGGPRQDQGDNGLKAPKTQKEVADALATLSAMFNVAYDEEVQPIRMEKYKTPSYCMSLEREPDGKPEYHDIKHYIAYQEYPLGASENSKSTIRRQHQTCGICHKCQTYADKVHASASPLHVLMAPRPFSMWGLDVIGTIEPKASNGHRFILVAIDYFTKWVEAASYKSITKQLLSRSYERTLYVGAIPFSLAYGFEAVLPVEVEVPFLRVIQEVELDEAKWTQVRYEQLNFIEERRLTALCRGQLNQKKIARA